MESIKKTTCRFVWTRRPLQPAFLVCVTTMKIRCGYCSRYPGLVLLIACANLANLMWRGPACVNGKWHLRLTLGASRSRLIRQLLAESLLLAGLGTIARRFAGADCEPRVGERYAQHPTRPIWS